MTGSILPSLTNPQKPSLSRHTVYRASSLLQHALRGATSSRSGTPGRKPLVFSLDKQPIAISRGENVTTIVETGEDHPSFHFIDEALEHALAFTQPQTRPRLHLMPPNVVPLHMSQGEELHEGEKAPAPSQLRSLVRGFHDRQREASLIVAASLATAIVLTLCGLSLLFAATTPSNAGPEKGKATAPENRPLAALHGTRLTRPHPGA